MPLKSVWVVEDDALYRSTLVRAINNSGRFRCLRSFPSCEEAIAELEKGWPPRVVMMDIVLPGIDGIAGAGKVKAISPSTDIVILTNYADTEKVFRALCGGASGYLLKTSPPADIKRAIEEVVRGGAPMNAQIARMVLDMFKGLSLPREEYRLTNREGEILRLLVDGMNKKKIAKSLFLSYFTVDTHIRNIYSKLHVHTKSGAVAKVLKEHLI